MILLFIVGTIVALILFALGLLFEASVITVIIWLVPGFYFIYRLHKLGDTSSPFVGGPFE